MKKNKNKKAETQETNPTPDEIIRATVELHPGIHR